MDANADVDTLKAIIEAETGIPRDTQILLHNGNPLPSGSSPLTQAGVQAGDLIVLVKASDAGASAAPPPPQQQATEAEAQALLRSLQQIPPDRLSQLPPPIREAIAAGDTTALLSMVQQWMSLNNGGGGGAASRDPFAAEEARLMALAEADPFNIDVQRQLEDLIQQRNVHENFDNAIEHNPESFGSVHMLYVPAKVNGLYIKAFVDSGAQITLMSKRVAEQCGLLRLVDKRFKAILRGAGEAQSLGRIHVAPLSIAGKTIPVSITVVESDTMPFLFGLDNLKRHQCSIDLKLGVLTFPAMDVVVPFLAEHEIPKFDIFTKEELEGMDTEAAPAAAGEAKDAEVVVTPPLQQPQQLQPAPSPPSSSSVPPLDAAAPPAGALPTGWEEKVQKLIALGFSREMCVNALRATNGDEEMAGSMLFGGF